jgi:hypothetical protein
VKKRKELRKRGKRNNASPIKIANHGHLLEKIHHPQAVSGMQIEC